MDMLIGGKHISGEDLSEVKNPYNNEVIDTIPIAHLQTAQMAIDEANKAKNDLVEMSAFKVSNKLYNVCTKLKEKREEFAELLTLEVGKPINESLVELDRSIETLKLAAEEAKRIYGESVPLDAGLNGKDFCIHSKVAIGCCSSNNTIQLSIKPYNPQDCACNSLQKHSNSKTTNRSSTYSNEILRIT